ncbi:cysteine--tRNA ligase [Candidatus Woesearchaeota archaeon]|nr:cysteine--tRNA ligase [Candidatus Woesearchaeota archaeon]
MALNLYNTLTRKKEELKPLHDKEVRMYSCGPTVYNFVHIGNLRSFMFVDILRRYIKYKGYKLKHVMNITDVDDKTIRDSKKQGKTLKEFTQFYTKAFLEDLKTLNIEKAEIMPKATEEIKVMVELVKKLLDKGYAYEAEDGIYFRISKFKNYGKLARLDLKQLQAGASGRVRADEYDKADVHDFVLWKFWDKDDGDVFWETEIGKGRPGWHIECSIMSSKYLGQPFDIHTGGVDLIFPHHTNEIAQSEAAEGKQFVKFWIHNDHLIVNGKKMSKSLGNFYTLRDLLDKGYDPKAIRYELLGAHYRQKLDFREDNLNKIPDTLQKFYDFLDKLDEIKEGDNNPSVSKLIEKAKKGFEKEMDNDLNISGALAVVFEFMTSVNKIMSKISRENAKDVEKTMMDFDSVLGIMKHEKVKLDSEIEALVKKREEARKKKDYTTADKIRGELKEKGIILEDTPQGVRWKKIK